MALIACRDVSFAYESNIVVSELNFEVNSGDYLCIVGENGSGKSTLIKGLLRLKQPLKGNVLVDREIKANEVGYLPQQTTMQKNFPASVYEVVISGRLNQRRVFSFYSKADRESAEENMTRLNIQGLRDRSYTELSGGQQQRILLARALCATKKMLILDEPVAGLDPMVTHDLYDQIYRINKETGITVIIVSHDIPSAVKYASHILHLKNSQEFFGSVADYIKSDVGKEFLGNA